VEANTIKSRARRSRFCRSVCRGLDEVIITLRETLGNCVLKRSRVDEGEKLLCRANRLMSSGRAHAHPTFQPVKEKVFAADDIVIVRSAMPASDASERWGDS